MEVEKVSVGQSPGGEEGGTITPFPAFEKSDDDKDFILVAVRVPC